MLSLPKRGITVAPEGKRQRKLRQTQEQKNTYREDGARALIFLIGNIFEVKNKADKQRCEMVEAALRAERGASLTCTSP